MGNFKKMFQNKKVVVALIFIAIIFITGITLLLVNPFAENEKKVNNNNNNNNVKVPSMSGLSSGGGIDDGINPWIDNKENKKDEKPVDTNWRT